MRTDVASRSSPVAPAMDARRAWVCRLGPWLLVAMCIAVYWNTLHAQFIFDDWGDILRNPQVKQWTPLAGLGSYGSRGLVVLTFILNYKISGFDTWSFHALNIAIHAGVALTLFAVLRRTLRSRRWPAFVSESADVYALVICSLWALHPLHTSAVSYAVHRYETLMALMFVLTFYCVIRGTASARSWAWYVGAFVCYVAGMLSKEVMVVVPALLVTYDVIFIGPTLWATLRRRTWLYLAMLLPLLLPLSMLLTGRHYGTAGFGFADLTPLDYARTELGVIPYYLRLSFWPNPLCVDYYDWPVARSLADVWSGAIITGGLLLATLWGLRRRPAWGFAGVWFFGILAPTSTFLPLRGELLAERRMYLPLVAVITLAVLCVAWLFHRIAERFPRARWASLSALPAVIVASALAVVTLLRNEDFRTAIAVLSDNANRRPNNARVLFNLSLAHADQGQSTQAITLCLRAMQMDSGYPYMMEVVGFALANDKGVDEAVAYYRQLFAEEKQSAEAHYMFGTLLVYGRRFEHARYFFEEAVRLRPDYADAQFQLGSCYSRLNLVDQAIPHLREAVRLKGNWPLAENYLAYLLAARPDATPADAAEALLLAQSACRETQYTQWEYLDTLAAAYAAGGSFDNAVQVAQKALELHLKQNARGTQAQAIESRISRYRLHQPATMPATLPFRHAPRPQ